MKPALPIQARLREQQRELISWNLDKLTLEAFRCQWNNCATMHEHMGLGLMKKSPCATFCLQHPPSTIHRFRFRIFMDLGLPECMLMKAWAVLNMLSRAPNTALKNRTKITQEEGTEIHPLPLMLQRSLCLLLQSLKSPMSGKPHMSSSRS